MNLEKIGKLKAEAPSQDEVAGLVRAGRLRLQDAERSANSPDSRFSLAYDAAHSFALAALRHHGYRSKDRYLVFQVLEYTLGTSRATWLFLADCHQRRNAALYDGDVTDDEQRIKELIASAHAMLAAVQALPPIEP